MELGVLVGLNIDNRFLLYVFPMTLKVSFTILTLVCLLNFKNTATAYTVLTMLLQIDRSVEMY